MAEQELSMDDQQALREKLSKMSPEELREFQKKQCIFCQIIEGKVAAKKIYEDEYVTAILDINPGNPGHVLLMTKEHYSIMPQIPDNEIAHVFKTVKKLSKILLKALKAQGTTIFVANGIAAGQRAQHFMVHIIPRMEGDKLNIEIKGKDASESELDELRDKIAQKVNIAFGIIDDGKGISAPIVEAEYKEKNDEDQEDDNDEDDEEYEEESEDDQEDDDKEESDDEENDEEEDDNVSLDDITSLLG